MNDALRALRRWWSALSVPPAAARLWANPPRWVIPVVAVVVVLVAVAAGGQVFGGAEASPSTWTSPSATASVSAPAGPRPSASPVKEAADLALVCEGWYYPASPRYAGRPPHQISVGVVDTPGASPHRIRAAIDVPYSLTKATRDAWLPSDPAKSQLVACVTLVKSGTQVKKCAELPMVRGVYQVALYEVATGRRLLQKQLFGDAVTCPNVAPPGTLASTVSDGVLYQLLRGYVTKK
jgi:hypothetical protein